MAKTIDMQVMRYINLFEKISGISTTNCFVYNNTIYFAVPKKSMIQAIGKNGANVKRVSEILSRKIRIVAMPEENSNNANSIRNFIMEIVAPVEITSFDLKDNIAFVSGDRESKAIIIGRDRSKEKELSEVLQRTIGLKDFKVI